MKKRLVVVVGILILLLPFVSAKAFTWTISSVNHQSKDAAGGSGGYIGWYFWKASLSSPQSISNMWAWGFKSDRSAQTSFIQELWLNTSIVATMRCDYGKGCVKYGPGTGWANIVGDEWVTTGCTQYCKDGCRVGPTIPPDDVPVVADTLVARYCYSTHTGIPGGVTSFEYDISIDRKNLAGSVNIDDEIKDITPDGLGALISLINASAVRVSSNTPGIMLWIGGDEDYTLTSTADFENSRVYACVDSDNNKICDGLQADTRRCRDTLNGSWYNGVCCGYDVHCGYFNKTVSLNTVYVTRDTSGNILNIQAQSFRGSSAVTIPTLYVLRNSQNMITAIRDTPANRFSAVNTLVVGWRYINSEYVWTISPSGGYTVVTLGTEHVTNAFCGNNSEGEWEWAPLADVGEIHAFQSCPNNSSIVSNGNAFYNCGNNVSGTIPLIGFLGISAGNTIHKYSCKDGIIEECAGSFGAFSSKNNVQTGNQMILNQSVYYCASDGDWTTDLDSKDKISCTESGFTWTGGACCSEAGDINEYYNDPSFPNATGGCWDKTYIPAGEFTVADRVINYKGRFYGCHIGNATGDDARILLKDSLNTTKKLINNSILPCGEVLMDARPGGMPHAVCQTNGKWAFTDEPGGTINKSIKWMPEVVTGIYQTGCCAYDQCWNGTKCQKLGELYRIADQGFICKLN